MGGGLTFDDVPDPVARPGAVAIRIEATPLLSYLRTFVAGGLTSYSPPGGMFTPGTGGAGVVEAVGDGVYHLAMGQAVLLSPYLTADERVPDPASTLISLHGDPQLNQMWRDGTLADKALMPASVVTPIPPGTGDTVRVTALTPLPGPLRRSREGPPAARGDRGGARRDGGLRAGRRTSRLGDGRSRGRGRRAKPCGLGRPR